MGFTTMAHLAAFRNQNGLTNNQRKTAGLPKLTAPGATGTEAGHTQAQSDTQSGAVRQERLNQQGRRYETELRNLQRQRVPANVPGNEPFDLRKASREALEEDYKRMRLSGG